MAVGQIKKTISLAYAYPFYFHASIPILINYNQCYHGNTVLYCNCELMQFYEVLCLLHVERHASCKVIWLCHKNVIN